MTKSELSKKLAEKVGMNKSEAVTCVDEVFATIRETIESGEDVHIYGFGTLKLKLTAAKTGRNPKTGEPVQIPARRKVAYKMAKDFKAALN